MSKPTQPNAEQTKGDPLLAELTYYKRRVEELSAETLKSEYTVSHLQHRLRQKNQGFAILAQLSGSLASKRTAEEILDLTAELVDGSLAMDRTAVLVPGASAGSFLAARLKGFPPDLRARRHTEPLRLAHPPETAGAFLLVNKATVPTPDILALRAWLELPCFLCVPVLGEGSVLALLVTGRLREARPLSPPLDDGDIDSFQAISALISATVRNMRVRLLEEMDKVKTEFFANISHEFRTPITLTLGPITGIRSGRFGAVSPAVDGQLAVVERNQRRLLDLIHQILDLAKLEAGALSLEAQRMADVNLYVSQRAELFREALEARGVELQLQLDERAAEADVYLDPSKFENVLLNLLSNAFKFTTNGKVTVETAVVGRSFVVTVRDTGPGMAPDRLEELFLRFHQAGSTPSAVQAGTGIGLAFAKEMTKLHGGSIEVRSVLGQGSAFHVTVPLGHAHLPPEWVTSGLPRAPASKGPVAPEAMEVPALPSPPERPLRPSLPTVLYVDDNADLRAYVPTVLQDRFNVLLAADGLEGLQMALAHRPDLILSDLQMPRLDGREFCRRAREEPSLAGIPFVLLTAQSADETKLRALDAGADDYLTKPFSEHELLARVTNLTRMRRQQVRLVGELEAARKIQRALLPPQTQHFSTLQVDALYRPCERLSGDFFDTLLAQDFLYLYVADVTSHGTAAAQVTYLVKTLVQGVVRAHPGVPLEEAVASVRQQYAELGLTYDVSLQLVRIHLGTRVLEYALCGSAPPVRVRAGAASSLPRELTGALSSRIPSAPPSRAHREQLLAGDRIFLFTDGCHEFLSGGRPFGMKRLLSALAETSGSPEWRTPFLDCLIRAHGSSGFPDDLTLVGIAETGRFPDRSAAA